MSEWLNEAFSGGVSFSRANPLGLILIAAAVILIAVARPVASLTAKISVQTIKLIGLVMCAVGTAIAIL